MTATIIDGKAVAARYREKIAADAAAFTEQHGYAPGLGVVLVGDNAASATYVRMKQKACDEVGLVSFKTALPEDTTQQAVEDAVRAFNEDERVHGILVQLPLPKHIDEEAVLNLISLEKDADGIHPMNMGLLALKGREAMYTPATPTGVMMMFEDAGIDVSGKKAVVIGRSNIVGIPMALLLNNANATVTIAHSRTTNTADLVRQADIVVAAAGVAYYVKADWLKPGAVVIDVGTNRVDDDTKKRGYRLVGDVDYDAAKAVASHITPVPGGVGPMTITALLFNTVKAARNQAGA
ncbi:MAG: bifunctional methylenetetrahydrofolate dehydrogenase/methenyltetrahydrofolate cyclohydrolase FolD [Chloroflexota bacterium]